MFSRLFSPRERARVDVGPPTPSSAHPGDVKLATPEKKGSAHVTFRVNDVAPNTKPLTEVPLELIVKHRCGGVKPEAHSQPRGRPVHEGVSRLTNRDKPVIIDNAFLSAVHRCWSDHYPLVLSPDMIWLCIAQGLSQHINANADKLRSRFVEHEGQKTLEVTRDDFVKGSPENRWPEVFESFSDQIRKHVGDKTHDLLTPTFSTTGPNERAAAQVVLMDCFKQYFRYAMYCVCGIPSITLEGTVDDWILLREKALGLAEYDLQWWIDALKPILNEFVNAASGTVNRDFWCRIYHQYGGGVYEPGPFVTGWILALFPYVRSHYDKPNEPNKFLTLWQKKDPKSHKAQDRRSFGQNSAENEGVAHYFFPPGVVSTPFIMITPVKTYDMHFYAGFMSISQDDETKAVRTEIGWAVTDDEVLQAQKEMRRGFW